MRMKKQQSHSVDFLFTLMTFLVYAGAMLMLVYMGTSVYKSVTQQMEQHYVTRTAQAYIVEKIRQNDKSGTISAGEVQEHPALILKETVGDEEYATYIYADGGKLKELFVKADSEFSLDMGMEMLDVEDFSIEETKEGLFKASVTDQEGVVRTFVVHRDSK